MGRMIINFLTLVSCVISINIQQHFFPNFPVGEFKVYGHAFINCKISTNQSFLFNFYMNKISSNTSEIRGNISFRKPIDDSYTLLLRMAVKGSNGGWKDNAFLFQSPKACTAMLNIIGPSTWSLVYNSMNIIGRCPLSAGEYVIKNGLDLTKAVSMANISKQFFYGSYKYQMEIIDKKMNQCGCITILIDFKRPWETN